tara:strand:- start:1736 stop:3751 length:2016 start_codon:yes stop_codon:yes gene_type:complete
MTTKLSAIFIVILNLLPPFVTLIDVVFICLIILLLISKTNQTPLRNLFFDNPKIILILVILTFINFFIPKLKIEEAHSIFINNNDINNIAVFFPKRIIKDIKKEFENFDFNRMIESYSGLNSIQNYKNIKSINTPYAYSADSFFQKNKFSRKVNNINFSSREELRIGQLNTLQYNLEYDKHFRRILPFYVFYEIPKIAKNSKLCTKGNIYYFFSKKSLEISEIKKINFTKKKEKKCLEINGDFEKLYIFGFSINEKDNISMQLKKSTHLNVIFLSKYLIILTVIFLLFFLLGFRFNINSFVYIISCFSTLFWTLIKDSNTIFGVRYFRGGADGLLHNSYAQDIIKYLNEGNYFLSLLGAENTFYNMPGLRYFGAFSKMFFGDTNFAYLIISTTLPLAIFVFFRKYINKKYSTILLISFVFFPIFENMGFGFFNYVWQAIRNHAETLSITLIVFALIYILEVEKNSAQINKNKTIAFFVGIFLAFAAILRPNFFPTSAIFAFYVTLFFILKKQYINSFLAILGFSSVLLCLFHNIYFGQSFYFFTNSHIHNFPLSFHEYINGIKNILFFDFQNEYSKVIYKQFLLWNPTYNLHRLIILAVIIYFVIKRQQTMFTYCLFMCAVAQHFVLLVTFPSSRYSYLAWLLTLMIFFKIESEQKIFKRSFLFIKEKLKL